MISIFCNQNCLTYPDLLKIKFKGIKIPKEYSIHIDWLITRMETCNY